MVLQLIMFINSVVLRLTQGIETNAAAGKNVEFCNTNSSQLLVDGDRNIPQRVNQACDKNAFYLINLKGQYFIHYVIIYEGEIDNDRSKLLDYFSVQLSNDAILYTMCSHYPLPSKGPSSFEGMRTNCWTTKEPYSYVKLKSIKNEGLDLSEIEVFSFGTMDDPIFIQRGCFKDFPIAKDAKTFDSIELTECYRYCVSLNYGFLAIKDNLTCECGETYNTNEEIANKTCHYLCLNPQYRCGGDGVFSVYLVRFELPAFTSCVSLLGEEKFHKKETFTDLTISKCVKMCEEYDMAAMERGTECICPDTEKVLFTPSEAKFCVVPCSGEANTMCGGIGHYSVYTTCSPGKSLACSLLLRCSENYDDYGVCIGGCQTGYSGLHCLEGGMVDEFDVLAYLPLLIPLFVIIFIIFCLLSGSQGRSASYSSQPSSKSSVVG